MSHTKLANTQQRLESPDEILTRSLRLALQRVELREPPSGEQFNEALFALDSLPLATAEYGRARVNLQNVAAYVRSREWGAARFELNALLRRMTERLNEPAAEPRRRLRRR